jgi:4-diphosphocytidyl-2-C-methyl-D-erythritol kinase
MILALPARAKLNLDLEVVGKRADGFHDIKTTIQSIDLHDLLEISQAPETRLTTTGLTVAGDATNSVLKAQSALEQAAKRKLPAHFHLHKRIPPGSGMGGASSDAATALKGLKAIYALQEVDLEEIAAAIGADVPYFLKGGRAHAEGRGEILTPLTIQPGWFVIAWPRIELLTADVYRAWDEVKGDGPNHLRRAAEHVDPRVKDFAMQLGDGWRMTGSGSAFFKTHDTENDATKTAARIDCWTAVTNGTGPWS